MSILIKDAEMPQGCGDCPCLGGEYHGSYDNNFYCQVTDKGIGEHRPDWCPLVLVPPHGRLIDADVLMLMIQEYIDEYGWDVDEHGFHSEKWCAMKETEMAINDAPTVIPADKDGEP